MTRPLPLLLLAAACAAQALSAAAHRADWLHECGWGVFTHYLPLNRDPPTLGSPAWNKTGAAAWNAVVDSFNATHLAEQLSSVGACYYFITIGQDSGWCASLPCRSPAAAPPAAAGVCHALRSAALTHFAQTSAPTKRTTTLLATTRRIPAAGT